VFSPISSPVYPRWRGEHADNYWRRGYTCGLSPLARGTRPQVRCGVAGMRFIPAGAGNTSRLTHAIEHHPVYPRWRGEHSGEYDTRPRCRGLSPLARGTLILPVLTEQPSRFIPAGAGNTMYGWGHANKVAVYPRWRGEHKFPSRLIANEPGLSPLARGTL